MNTRKLRRLLEGLEREISETKIQDPELENSLQSIAKQVEQSITELDDSSSLEFDHETLIERASDALEAFETTHPRLTSVLSDLLSSLSQNRV